jgi:UDP-N-acetylmuramate dehydrogenase
MNTTSLSEMRTFFGNSMQENVPLSGYTVARIGGPADVLVFVHSADELVHAAGKLWEMEVPFLLLGGGSNVLVSDRGVRGVVIVNRSKLLKFSSQSELPTVLAESGVSPNDIAQRAARLGLAGFEWAASIPGSLGGAVYGNAGAFGGEISMNLISVDLIHRQLGNQTWSVENMEYSYRTSRLKREHPPAIILSARLMLRHGDRQEIQNKMEQFSIRRRATQPPGASMGSIFKNPPGDKAGRLIEASGLKGRSIGNSMISTQHANFFINNGMTKAADMHALIELAQNTVLKDSGIQLEPEVELIGDW